MPRNSRCPSCLIIKKGFVSAVKLVQHSVSFPPIGRKKELPDFGMNEPPHIVRTVQKRGLQGGRTSESKTGLAKRERSQASLCLEALVVIEVDILVDQIVGLLKCLELLAEDAFCYRRPASSFSWTTACLLRYFAGCGINIQLFKFCICTKCVKDAFQRTVITPAAKAAVYGLMWPISCRKVFPTSSAAGNP